MTLVGEKDKTISIFISKTDTHTSQTSPIDISLNPFGRKFHHISFLLSNIAKNSLLFSSEKIKRTFWNIDLCIWFIDEKLTKNGKWSHSSWNHRTFVWLVSPRKSNSNSWWGNSIVNRETMSNTETIFASMAWFSRFNISSHVIVIIINEMSISFLFVYLIFLFEQDMCG